MITGTAISLIHVSFDSTQWPKQNQLRWPCRIKAVS